MQRAKLEIALKLYTWMSGDTLHFFPKSKLSFRPWRLLNSCQTSVKSTQSISISEDSQPAIYHYPCTTWDCLLMAVGNGSQVPIFVFFFEGLFLRGCIFTSVRITAHYSLLHSQHLFALFSGGSRTLTQLERRLWGAIIKLYFLLIATLICVQRCFSKDVEIQLSTNQWNYCPTKPMIELLHWW